MESKTGWVAWAWVHYGKVGAIVKRVTIIDEARGVVEDEYGHVRVITAGVETLLPTEEAAWQKVAQELTEEAEKVQAEAAECRRKAEIASGRPVAV